MEINNMNDIRAVLCANICNLHEGKVTPATVNATTSSVGKIISTIRLEMDYAKLNGRAPTSSFIQLEEVKLDQPGKIPPPAPVPPAKLPPAKNNGAAKRAA